MTDFIGTYRNLIGQQLTGFKITGLSGRDSSGAPAFRVECDKCLCNQTVVYAKLAPLVGSKTQRSLLCANPACPASRHQRHVETLSDIRREERKQQEAADRQAAAEQLAAERIAAKHRAQTAKFTALQIQYRRYWVHQIQTNIQESAIASFSRWCKLSDASREKLLDICATDPTVQIHGF
jgi:hypothetical protein